MRHVPATKEKTAWRDEASRAPAAQISRYASSTWLGSAKRFLREKEPRKERLVRGRGRGRGRGTGRGSGRGRGRQGLGLGLGVELGVDNTPCGSRGRVRVGGRGSYHADLARRAAHAGWGRVPAR